MWLLLAGCGEQPTPAAFDWRWDHTRVAAVRIWPLDAEAGIPRTIEALVISPSAEPWVRVEVCGFDPELAVHFGDPSNVRCFNEPDLVEVLADTVPATWTPPEVTFACPYGYGQPVDSAEPPPMCSTYPLLRVVAGDDEGESSSVLTPGIEREPYDPRDELDPTTADPRLEVVGGTVAAGERVLLRFSVAEAWAAPDGHHWTVQFPQTHWYVEAGEPYGSAVTGPAGFDDDGRPYAQSWLAIPDDHHGRLRVAVVRNDLVPVWAELALEVP